MCKDERDARVKAAQGRAAAENEALTRAFVDINEAYAEADSRAATDAVPRPEGPPAILARHAKMHRDIGLKLREQALQLLEQSMQHLAAAGDLDAARRRILDSCLSA